MPFARDSRRRRRIRFAPRERWNAAPPSASARGVGPAAKGGELLVALRHRREEEGLRAGRAAGAVARRHGGGRGARVPPLVANRCNVRPVARAHRRRRPRLADAARVHPLPAKVVRCMARAACSGSMLVERPGAGAATGCPPPHSRSVSGTQTLQLVLGRPLTGPAAHGPFTAIGRTSKRCVEVHGLWREGNLVCTSAAGRGVRSRIRKAPRVSA